MKYKTLLQNCEHQWKRGLAYKSSTHDSVFYINAEGEFGFKAIKFYDGTMDYRVGSRQEQLAEAFNEAIHVL